MLIANDSNVSSFESDYGSPGLAKTIQGRCGRNRMYCGIFVYSYPTTPSLWLGYVVSTERY